ncbi:MAG: bile acid:sodium symporter [Desulfobacteraceae bacterium]|nr:bile acid:sodium symporter [Desulfobacteraceae bacterium]
MFFKQHLHYFIVCVLLAGLVNVYFLGGFNTPKAYLIFIVVAFVIFPVMINTDFWEIFDHFREPRPVFCSIILNFLISPAIAFMAGSLFLRDQPLLFTGLILISLIPTSSMSMAWTSFSNANLATALYLTPLNILFAAFIGLPLIFPLLADQFIEINTLMIVRNIITVFFIPLIIGGILRKLIIRFKGDAFFSSKIQPNVGIVSGAGLLVLIFLVMSQERNAMLLENYRALVFAVIPVILYYALMYAVSVFWMKQLVSRHVIDSKKGLVLVYTSVARHINIAIAIALSSFTVDQGAAVMFVLIIAYLVQVPGLAFFAQKFGKNFIMKTTDASL